MKEELVSILIPVFRRADLAIETIECTLHQDYKNIEIIIIDNNSDDNTFTILKDRFGNIGNIRLYQNKTNIGAARNWKRCLEKAEGKYAMFLWSDDLIADDFVSTSVKYLEEHPNASFSFCSVIMFSNSEDVQIFRNNISRKQIIRKQLDERYKFGKEGEYTGEKFISAQYRFHRFKVPVSPACALFRTNKIKISTEIPNEFGYQHNRNGAGVDLLIFLNALEQGNTFCYIDEPMSFFRGHPDSISTFDKTIEIGYRTAEDYFSKMTKSNKYNRLFNADIVIGKIRLAAKKIRKDSELGRYYYSYKCSYPYILLIPTVLSKLIILFLYRKVL